MKYKPSYYNIRVDHDPWMLLYNGASSGLIKLQEPMAKDLLPFLGPNRGRDAGVGLAEWDPPTFEPADLPESLQENFDQFLEGRYFVPADEDERSTLEEGYNWRRKNSPFQVTITTTLDCNLGCYYCYEDKTKQYLTHDGCDIILDWIRQQAIEKKHERLFVDWYGGEPMLNQSAIEYFSEKALAMCDELGIQYSAAMISNGTRWPDSPEEFVKKINLGHVQFTLDGPKSDHNKRRRYVDKAENPNGSFDKILETIDQLIGKMRIYLRVNVDPWVGRRALELIDVFEERNWLQPGLRFYPTLAAIGPMTEHCGFLGQSKEVQDFQNEFEDLSNEFAQKIAERLGTDSLNISQYYPRAVDINCAAVGENSIIFGPEGKMYKCCLEVGDVEKAHDETSFVKGQPAPAAPANSLPIVSAVGKTYETDRWNKYDPFSHEKCSECQYLPVCMGGCPKVQMDKNQFYLDLQSKYWEENIDEVIKNYFDASLQPS